MASPFDKFRKKQKVMLAILGVLCMFGFIVGPMIADSMGPGPREGKAIVRIFDETLNDQDVNDLLRERQIATQFVAYLHDNDREAAFGQVTQQSSVIVEALAREAEALGIIISDDAINKFIDDANYLQRTRQQINEYFVNAEWDPEIVFRALRRELMCMQLQGLYFPFQEGAVVSPARLWDYYQRLHRRAKIDALPVDAHDFLDQVGDPSETELTALFDEFKNFPNIPNMPNPGFTLMATATVEYIRADYDKFYEAAESEITEEELKEYYESQKATQYPYSGFILDEDPIVAPPATNDSVPGQDDETSDESTTDANANQSGDGSNDDNAAGDGSSDAGSSDSGTGGDDGNPQETFPVSFVEPQDAQGDANQGSSDVNQGDGNQAGANQNDAGQNDAGQDDANQGTGQPDLTSPSATQEADIRSLRTIADQFRMPADILDGPDPEFEPYWRVRDRILEKLANEKATERIEAGIAAVREPLEAFKAELVAYQNTRGDQEDPNNAPRRKQVQDQVAAAAAEHGLEFVTDGADKVNQFEFSEIEDLQGVSSVTGQSFRSLIELIFSPTASIYELTEGSDADSNKFLAWKTAETDVIQPKELDDVREKVEDAWRLREAKKIAKAKAEEIAEKVEGGQDLDSFVSGDNKVLHPEPFTWFTQNYDPSIMTPQMIAQLGINFPPYTISVVEDLERLSDDFMKSTFALQESDTGVAPNEAETIYYVVTVNRYDYETGFGGTREEDARRMFLLTDPSKLEWLYRLDYRSLRERVQNYRQSEHIEWLVPLQ